MVLSSIQRLERGVVSRKNELEFHTIKHKNGSGKSIWNVEREVEYITKKNRCSFEAHAIFGDGLHMSTQLMHH